MLELVTNLFSRKVGSLEKFIEIVKSKNYSAVVVRSYATYKSGYMKWGTGPIGTYHYMLEYTVTTPSGRKKILYKEELSERFGSHRGYPRGNDLRDATIEHLLLSEVKVGELQEQLPSVQVSLMRSEDEPVDYDKLHKDAEAYGISL